MHVRKSSKAPISLEVHDRIMSNLKEILSLYEIVQFFFLIFKKVFFFHFIKRNFK